MDQHDKNVEMCLWEVAEAADNFLNGPHDEGLAKSLLYLSRAHRRLVESTRIRQAIRKV